jgi:hypothetical protein
MIQLVETFKAKVENEEMGVKIRIGLHSGEALRPSLKRKRSSQHPPRRRAVVATA